MTKKIAAWAGMLGPALFTISFTVNGFLQPGYEPARRYISELSIGPHGWIQIVSFMLLGICLILFALGLRASFPRHKASSVLFMVIAVCYFFSGPFVTDPMAMFDNQQTLHGTVHGILGAIVFSLSAASCFVLWRRFRADENWKSLSAFSLAAGIAMAVLIVLMKIGQLRAGPLADYAGVVQRCCLVTSYVWIFAISLNMRKV